MATLAELIEAASEATTNLDRLDVAIAEVIRANCDGITLDPTHQLLSQLGTIRRALIARLQSAADELARVAKGIGA